MKIVYLREKQAWFIRFSLLLACSLAFGCHTEAKKTVQTFALGGQKLHEKLSYFKRSFPKSACGTPLDLDHVNRHTLDDLQSSDWLTCCVDDAEGVSAFSKFPILSLDNNCPVLAIFYRERLHDVSFRIDVSSLELVLPDLVKRYGRVYEERNLRTKTVPVRLAMWMGDDIFEVCEELVSAYDPASNPSLTRYGRPDSKIVLFTMWECGTSRGL